MVPIIFQAALHSRSGVGTDEELEKLKAEIIDLSLNTPPMQDSNAGCWRGGKYLENFGFVIKEINELVQEAIEYYCQLDSTFASRVKSNWRITYWANVNEPKSRNVLHNHANSVFSGTYYIQAKNTGALRMLNPANTVSFCNSSSPFARDIFIKPREKDLILWPSWIPHEVETNLSNKDRINVAYDVVFEDVIVE